MQKEVSIDIAGGLARLGGNRELYCQLIGFYREDYPALVKDLQNAIEQRDRKKAAHSAHSLKGLAAGVGAVSAEALAHEIEEECPSASFSALEETAKLLEEHLRDSEGVLSNSCG